MKRSGVGNKPQSTRTSQYSMKSDPRQYEKTHNRHIAYTLTPKSNLNHRDTHIYESIRTLYANADVSICI